MQAFQSAVRAGSTTEHGSRDPSWMTQAQPPSDRQLQKRPQGEVPGTSRTRNEKNETAVVGTLALPTWVGLFCSHSIWCSHASTVPLLRILQWPRKDPHCPSLPFLCSDCSLPVSPEVMVRGEGTGGTSLSMMLNLQVSDPICDLEADRRCVPYRLSDWLSVCCLAVSSFSLLPTDRITVVKAGMTHSSSLTILWTLAFTDQILLSLFKFYVCVGGGLYRGQKSVSDSLELWFTSGCERTYVGVGNWTRVLSRNSTCSWPLNRICSPANLTSGHEPHNQNRILRK